MPAYQVTFLLSGSEPLVEHLRTLPPASSGSVTLETGNLLIEVEVSNERNAEPVAALIAEQFCDTLSLRTGEHFAAQYRQHIERPAGRLTAVLPITVRDVSYRLEDLPTDVQGALEASEREDDVLHKASAYFRHALFLHQDAWRYVVPGSLHWQLFTAGALLHYNKATSIIVGDPAIDHRDYQSRYRTYGISDDLFRATVELRGLRDTSDVVHHALDWEALERAKESIQFAKATARAVVRAYETYVHTRS